MKTLSDIKSFFRQQLKPRGLTQAGLEREAGIAHQTAVNVLGGGSDFKVSTLLAVADRLGYEMVFVPKAAARAFSNEPDRPAVKSLVDAALERRNRKVLPQ